jgi:hypothetical protein
MKQGSHFSCSPYLTQLSKTTVCLIMCAVVLVVGGRASAQTHELQSEDHPLAIDSGLIAAPAVGMGKIADEHGRVLVHQETIRFDRAPWLRLQFGAVVLSGNVHDGTGAVLRITSLTDAGVQLLDALTIQQWRYTSAYFNGEGVTLELLAFPDSGMNRISVTGIAVGVEPDDDMTPASVSAWMSVSCPSPTPMPARCRSAAPRFSSRPTVNIASSQRATALPPAARSTRTEFRSSSSIRRCRTPTAQSISPRPRISTQLIRRRFSSRTIRAPRIGHTSARLPTAQPG